MKTTDFINTYTKEGVDPNEYNDEAPMIKNDLHTIVRVSTHLNKALGEHENLPVWVIEKIAQTKGMIVSVMDYMISQHEMGQKEEVPGFDADRAEQMFESVLAEETLPWETDQEAREREAGRKEKSSFKKPNNPNRMPRDTVKALAQKGIPKNSANNGVTEDTYNDDVKRAFPGGKSTGVKTHSNKPAVVKTDKPIGTRVSDIDPWSGKESNVKTDSEWDKQKGVEEATGDPKFDKMLTGITGKKAVAKQQKADTKQQARDAFGGMFGGGNPADKLKIKEQGMAEGNLKEDASAGASGASSFAVTMETLGGTGGFTKADLAKQFKGYSNMKTRGGPVKVKNNG